MHIDLNNIPTQELQKMYNNPVINEKMAFMVCDYYRTTNNAGYITRVAATTAEKGNENKTLTPTFAMALAQNIRDHNTGAFATLITAIRAALLTSINARKNTLALRNDL